MKERLDPNKPIYTIAALEAAMTALLNRISQHDRDLSTGLIVDFANAIRTMPANMRGSADMLAVWKELLENPTNPEDVS